MRLNSTENDDSRSVAVCWDFENLHAGLVEVRHGEGAYAKQDNRDHGHEKFADMVKALDAVVESKKGESDHLLRLR